MMEAKDKKKDSYIIEFKVFDAGKDKNLEECADRALEQIERKGYDKALVARQIIQELEKMDSHLKGKSAYKRGGGSESKRYFGFIDC